MKRSCIAGLLAVASWSLAAGAAPAQTSATQRPYLVPLPPVNTQPSGLRAAAYNTEPQPATQPASPTLAAPKAGEQFDSAFPTAPPPTDSPAPAETPPAAAPTEYEQALKSTCWDDCDGPECTCNGGFFAAGGGIVMTRNRANAISLTYEVGTDTPLMNTQDAAAGWAGGGQVTLGYAFGGPGGPGSSGQWGAVGTSAPAVAFTWWGTGEMNGFASVRDPGNLTASFNIPAVSFSGGQTFADYFDNASEQRLWRTDNVNSIEANVFDGSVFNSSHLQIIALAGFRYFRFRLGRQRLRRQRRRRRGLSQLRLHQQPVRRPDRRHLQLHDRPALELVHHAESGHLRQRDEQSHPPVPGRWRRAHQLRAQQVGLCHVERN
jgi:hypothetical protein